MKSIGLKIRELRKNKNLSMEDLAKEVGVTRSQISLYELDKSSPNAIMIRKLSTALGVNESYFFGESAVNEPQASYWQKKYEEAKKELDETKEETLRLYRQLMKKDS